MKIEFEIADDQRLLLLSLADLLLTDEQCDLLIEACNGKTFPASSLSAAVAVLAKALEPDESQRTHELLRRDQEERLSCSLPRGIGGFI